MRTLFIYMMWTWGLHLFTWCGHEDSIYSHDVDMRTPFIHMVWTWGRHLFTWCGHEDSIYSHDVDMRTPFIHMVSRWGLHLYTWCFNSIVQWLWKFMNHKIIISYMGGNKCGNVLLNSFSSTFTSTRWPSHRKKVIYIYIYNSHINCGNDKKNQRLYNNQFDSYNSYRNNPIPTIMQSNIQVFHWFHLPSSLLNIWQSLMKIFPHLSTFKYSYKSLKSNAKILA